jgi:hypothetical protein
MADEYSRWWLTARAAPWHITKTKASYLVQRPKLFVHAVFGILSAAAALDVRVAQRRWRSSVIPTLICFWKYFRVPLYDPEVNPEFRIDEPRWPLESHDWMPLVDWHVSVYSHPSSVLGPFGPRFNRYWTKNDQNGNLVAHLHLVPSVIAAVLARMFYKSRRIKWRHEQMRVYFILLSDLIWGFFTRSFGEIHVSLSVILTSLTCSTNHTWPTFKKTAHRTALQFVTYSV